MAAFSLTALLRLRRLQQDRAAADVSLSRARAAELASRRRFAQNSLATLMSSDGSSERLRWTAAARAASSSTLGDLQALASETDEQVEEADAQFAETRARTITLEKLEARHDAAELSESLRQEQISLDEISSRRFDPTGKQVAP